MPTLDGTSLSSVYQLEIQFGHVLNFDLPKELPETLVKNKDSWALLQTCTQGRSMGMYVFNHLPMSVLFALKKDSEYKFYLVSGILTGLWVRVYC